MRNYLQADSSGDAPEVAHDATVIDCDSCAVRGLACGDCVVSVLLGAPPEGVHVDADERQAIETLSASGLVPPLRMVRSVTAPPVDADPESPPG